MKTPRKILGTSTTQYEPTENRINDLHTGSTKEINLGAELEAFPYKQGFAALELSEKPPAVSRIESKLKALISPNNSAPRFLKTCDLLRLRKKMQLRSTRLNYTFCII